MIKCVRLVTGEDIICDLELPDLETKKYRFKKPALIMMVQTAENKVQFRMIPWIPFAGNENFDNISESLVALVYDPNEGLRNEYSTRYGSGLIIPQLDTKSLLTES